MIYYVPTLTVVLHIQFLIYKIRAVFQRRYYRQAKTVFNLASASYVRDIYWSELQDSSPRPNWRGILLGLAQHLVWQLLSASSLSPFTCGYSSRCIYFYDHNFYHWVISLWISSWQSGINRHVSGWVFCKGSFVILARSLTLSVAISTIY